MEGKQKWEKSVFDMFIANSSITEYIDINKVFWLLLNGTQLDRSTINLSKKCNILLECFMYGIEWAERIRNSFIKCIREAFQYRSIYLY